jgi:hypothetical protein
LKEIPLTRGLVALVDDEDYEELNRYNWIELGGYAVRSLPNPVSGRRQTKMSMHRYIMGLKYGDPTRVDHKNTDGLDNRRENLRICSQALNARNRAINKNNTSGFKGVSWLNKRKKWVAVIRLNNKSKHLGSFSTPEEAHAAYCKAADILHGEFANYGTVTKERVTSNEFSSERPPFDSRNSRLRSDNKSGLKGVRWHSRDLTWTAQITMNGKQKHLGTFDSAESAHAAYLKATEEIRSAKNHPEMDDRSASSPAQFRPLGDTPESASQLVLITDQLSSRYF